MLKCVIFDVGGVLLTLGEAPYRRDVAQKLGLESLPPRYLDAVPALQRGELPEADLWRELGGRPIRPESFDEIFLAHFPLIDEMQAFAAELRGRGVRTALLSNTQHSHVRCMHRLGFVDHFDPLFFSCEVGRRKPEPGIFEHALSELGLAPNEVAFIDDVQEYADVASALGIHGIRHTGDVGRTRAQVEALL